MSKSMLQLKRVAFMIFKLHGSCGVFFVTSWLFIHHYFLILDFYYY